MEAKNYLENLKIVMTDVHQNVQHYQVQDKATGKVFVERAVTYDTNDEITAQKCQEDYCEWFRRGGKNLLREYYKANG